MNPQAEAGHPSGDVFRDATAAHHGFAKTAIRGTRSAAIITIVLALLTGCGGSIFGSSSGVSSPSASCGGGSGVTVGHHPELLPIEISLAQDGSIEVSLDPGIATPVGTFSLGVPVACWKIAPNGTLLAISHLVHHFVSLGAQRGREGGDEELVRYD